MTCPTQRKFTCGIDCGMYSSKTKVKKRSQLCDKQQVNFTADFKYILTFSKTSLSECFRNWLNVAKRLSSPEEAQTFALDTIEGEIAILEKEISGDHQRIGFCHNDLQYGNLMFAEETKSVTIIVSFYLS